MNESKQNKKEDIKVKGKWKKNRIMKKKKENNKFKKKRKSLVDLISLFNGISIVASYSMLKPFLQKNISGPITHY